MSGRIRVRVTAEFEIDTAAWHAAAIEAEHLQPGELDTDDHQLIAEYATGYTAAEDHLPRWARDSMTVVSESTEIRQGQ
jgi:hypothetical protein